MSPSGASRVPNLRLGSFFSPQNNNNNNKSGVNISDNSAQQIHQRGQSQMLPNDALGSAKQKPVLKLDLTKALQVQQNTVKK